MKLQQGVLLLTCNINKTTTESIVIKSVITTKLQQRVLLLKCNNNKTTTESIVIKV